MLFLFFLFRTYPAYTVVESGAMYSPGTGQYYTSGSNNSITYSQVAQNDNQHGNIAVMMLNRIIVHALLDDAGSFRSTASNSRHFSHPAGCWCRRSHVDNDDASFSTDGIINICTNLKRKQQQWYFKPLWLWMFNTTNNPCVVRLFRICVNTVSLDFPINNFKNTFRMATVPLRLIWLRVRKVIAHRPLLLLSAAAPILNRTTVLLTPPGSPLPL